MRRPLPDMWRDLSEAGRVKALPYWINKAEHDPWAFRQLGDLAAVILDAGDRLPAPLSAFATEVLRGARERPKRWRSDPSRDARIAGMVLAMHDLGGMSQRQACRIVGEALRMSPEAVESARRRGLAV